MSPRHLALAACLLTAACGAPERKAAPAESETRPSPALRAAAETARASLRGGKAEEAVALLAPFERDASADAAFHALLGQALFESKRHDEAVAAYQRARALAPELPAVHRNLGLAQLESSRLVLGSTLQLPDLVRAARASFEKAASLDPADAEAAYLAGFASAQLGETERALRDYDRALALDGGHARALRERGRLLLQGGAEEEAAAALERARAADPKDAPTASLLGRALAAQGRDAEALPHLLAATELDPLSREAHYTLALAASRLGRDAEAAAARGRFESLAESGLDSQAVALAALPGGAGGDARFHARLGLQHEQDGRLEPALESYRRALAIDASLADVHLRAGAVLVQLGRAAEGETHLSRCVELAPDLALARLHLAAALEAQGRVEEAIAALREAASRDPSSPHAHRNLALLLQRVGATDEARREAELAERLARDAAP